jgi:hypothetical protein
MDGHAPSTGRPYRPWLDWATLVIPLLALVAAWPTLTQSLPNTDDGALHMLRLVQLDRCLQHGRFCLRWAPDFAHGYGYPGFNYYMNLPTIYAEGLHLLGLRFPQAMAGGFLTALVLSGWGVYLLGRELAGRCAGLVAAVAYMYAPYQFFDSAYRGNLPESWALALVPWVLWTARRAAVRRRWRAIVPFAAAYGALLFTHNIYALITSVLLGAYLALLWWQGARSLSAAGRLGAMVLLGLALGAFFWMPAFFERGWTRYSPGLFDVQSYFLPLRELLAPPSQHDLSALNPDVPRSLSWGMLGLVVAGGAGWLLGRGSSGSRADRQDLPAGEWFFFAIVLVVTAALTLPVAAPLYRLFRPLQWIQMPWRLLGLTSLAGSVCAGWAVALLPNPPRLWSPRLIGTCAAIVVLIATAVPWTYAVPFPQPQDLGVDEIIGWEYATGLIGGTSAKEFLPVWSSGVPEAPAHPSLLSEQDPIIDRLDETSLPEGASIVSAEYGIMDARLRIETPVAFRATYKQFYFPGWRVEVDGRAVPPIALAPYGLLGFDIPPGEHEVVVRPATTPVRTAGTAIAVAGVACAVALLLLDRSRPSPAVAHRRPIGARRALVFGSLGVLILLAKDGWVDRTENVFRARRLDRGTLRGVDRETLVRFGDRMTLLGYAVEPQPVVSGRPLRVDLYLSAQRAVEGDYMAYARLVDGDGRLWSLPDNGRPDGYRPPPSTQIWPTDAYGHWAYLTYTLPGTPPGRYWVEIALFERETWRGLNVLDGQGRVTGVSERIGPVEVIRPRAPPAIDTLGLDHAIERQVAPGLRCLGTTQTRRSAQAGDAFQITAFWEATALPPADYFLEIALVSPTGATLLASDLPLGRSEYPTSRWDAGEIVRSPHSLRIAAALQAASYTIEGTVVDGRGEAAGEPFQLGAIEIEPTERVFALPAGVTGRTDVVLGRLVSLAGYDLAQSKAAPGGALEVTLYWEALQEMQTSYKTFVQLVGPDGVLSQVDAVPAGWQRPTTGWVPGEVIADSYRLPIPGDAPAVTYALIAGMYEEETMNRLRVLDEQGGVLGDHVVLDEIVVR